MFSSFDRAALVRTRELELPLEAGLRLYAALPRSYAIFASAVSCLLERTFVGLYFFFEGFSLKGAILYSDGVE